MGLKSLALKALDAFLYRNPWFIWLFLDRHAGGKKFLQTYLGNRPLFFERYMSWKPVSGRPKRILIVKTDAIGDYLLFRNFLEDLRNRFPAPGYELCLLGNQLWEGLATHLDGDKIDRFFWLRRGGLNTKPSLENRMKVVWEAAQFPYESILYPNISREHEGGDWLIRHIPALTKTAFNGDTQNQKPEEKIIGDQAYTHLIEPQPGTLFEFFRNREVVSAFVGASLHRHFPALPKPKDPAPISKEYAVLFPGASFESKQWPVERFSNLAGWIAETQQLTIVLAGSPSESALCDIILQNNPASISIAGKTSLTDLLHWIGHAKILVSNDTAALHMGAQMGIPSVCPFKGNHYGRFLPYPAEHFPFLKICLPFPTLDWSEDMLIARYSETYGGNIGEVTEDQVRQAVTEVLEADQ
jgi:ADP-heptose:LPS heptosyltransferase